jgi:hypothetical protein
MSLHFRLCDLMASVFCAKHSRDVDAARAIVNGLESKSRIADFSLGNARRSDGFARLVRGPVLRAALARFALIWRELGIVLTLEKSCSLDTTVRPSCRRDCSNYSDYRPQQAKLFRRAF